MTTSIMRCAAALAALVTLGAAAAPEEPAGSPQRNLQAALQRCINPQPEEAKPAPMIASCTDALDIADLSREVRGRVFAMRGLAHGIGNQTDKAIADFTEALRLVPDDAVAFMYRGDGYSELRQYGTAIEDYTRSIELRADLADAYAGRSYSYFQTGQYAKAIDDIDRAIAIDATNSRFFDNRCGIRAFMGKELERALLDCNESVRLNPSGPMALSIRALVHFRMGRFNDAITDENAALKISPGMAQAHYIRGLAKQRMGDAAGARTDIETAKLLQSDIADQYARIGVR